MLSIGEVARRAGLRPSAIRYYERLGLLPVAARTSGRRRYGEEVLLQLRVIEFARQGGFALREIRELFGGRPYSARFRQLAARKIAELDHVIERAREMQSMLRYARRCQCVTLEQCGRRLRFPA